LEERLDAFLRFNDRAVLPNAGAVSREEADRRAHDEYALLEERRRLDAERAGEPDHVKMLERTASDLEKTSRSLSGRKRRKK
jgi:hypothetical protein